VLGKRRDKVFGPRTSAATASPWRHWARSSCGSAGSAFNPGSVQLAAEPLQDRPHCHHHRLRRHNRGHQRHASLAYLYTRKWDVSMAFNGALGGLVAITAGCAFVTPMAALVIGTIAGAIAYYGVQLMERAAY
jgi:hypothetical protein